MLTGIRTIAASALVLLVIAAPALGAGLDLDALGTAAAAPTAGQRDALARLDGARATFNRFGTPASLSLERGVAVAGADPVARARAFLVSQRALFGLGAAEVAELEVVHDLPLGEHGRSVLLRQRFGDLDAGAGLGQVAVALRDAEVVYASSTLAPAGGAPAPATLSAQEAFTRAAEALDLHPGAITNLRSDASFGLFDVAGLSGPGRARLVALPVPGGAPRAAFQTIVLDDGPLAVTSYIDARTGEVLLRHDNVDHALDNPQWDVSPANPPARQRWCWTAAAGCDRVIGGSGTPERTGEWDTLQATPDGPATSTLTTVGNAARTEDASESSPLTPGAFNPGALDPTRTFGGASAPYTDAWKTAGCNPAGFTSLSYPDVAAAKVNLFVQHNRMHDFAYRLGFTEAAYNLQANNFGRGGSDGDPELGGVQAGADVGSAQDQVAGRDNANQITLDDGIAPITNMYLWQPIGAAFYSPCVDGDFDMSVIGHEYTHAISNRMVGGPSGGLDTNEGGSMGESYSDLDALEYLHAYGFVPVANENPWSVGAFVTGDPDAGIRNYALDRNPLNYSDLGYDVPGAEVHSDGEVWNGINWEVRQAYNRRYGSGNAALQASCADGLTPVEQCPGNRRWIQTMYDAFLLMQPDVSMVTARDAYLAADRARFGGANQDLLWDAFARRGLGEDAVADPRNLDGSTNVDVSPKPSFSSPVASDDTVVTFAPSAPKTQIFVGAFEARVTPVADTDPATPIGPDEPFRPGGYDFIARADGYGAVRFHVDVPAGRSIRVELPMVRNVASAAAGAVATGDATPPGSGVDPTAEPPDPARLLRNLIDDTEATNWATAGAVAGRSVTVALAGGEQLVDRVQVSALLRAADPADPGGDTSTQNRYTALRSFALEACTGACTTFTRFYTSPADAFPGHRPRPRVPDLQLRSFDVPDVRASQLRLVVLSNQCTGGPDFQSDQDADPLRNSDCAGSSTRDEEARAAELQVFSSPAPAPVVTDTTPGLAGQPSGPVGVPACATTAGFKTVRVAPAKRGLRLTFSAAGSDRKPDIDVYQVSRGKRVLGERLVARFANRSKSFTWNGRANRKGRTVGDGYYFVRYRAREADGKGTDTRRIAVQRVKGRFHVRAAFDGRATCGTIRSAKLERPVFGGTDNRALNISFAVAAPASVTVTVKRGSKALRTYRVGTVSAAKTQRLRFPAEKVARGNITVRIAATRNGRTETRTLTARRI